MQRSEATQGSQHNRRLVRVAWDELGMLVERPAL
jgi:hypothetical protein